MNIFNNRGFTLAEVLVTLGIIGVIAAVLLPVSTALRPDKTKVQYLKVYNTLTDAIKDLANSSKAFPVCQEDYCFERNSLYNNTKGVGEKYPEGNGKICKILADKFNASENTCSDNYEQFDGEHFSFTAQDGTEFFVSTFRSEPNGTRASFQTDVWVDLNGSAEPNKSYGEDDCNNPDRFKFMIAADGTLVVADPMGEAYVNTSKNWINTNYEIADGAGVKNDLDPNLKDFDITVKPEEEDNNNETPKQEPIECANNFVLINGVCKDPTKETLIVTLQPYPTDTYYLPGKFGTKAYHDMDVKITLSAPCQENVWFVYNMWNQADSRYNEWIDGGCYVKPGETSCMKRPLQPNKNLRKIFPDSPWCMYFSRGSTFKPFKNVKIVVDKTYLSVDQMGHESSLTNTYNIQGSNGIIEYSYTDEGYQKLLNYSDEYTYNAQKQYSQTLD